MDNNATRCIKSYNTSSNASKNKGMLLCAHMLISTQTTKGKKITVSLLFIFTKFQNVIVLMFHFSTTS